MVATALAAPALKPTAEAAAIDLEAAVPAAFAGWRIDPEVVPVTAAPDVQANLARLYDQVVARTYVNAQGRTDDAHGRAWRRPERRAEGAPPGGLLSRPGLPRGLPRARLARRGRARDPGDTLRGHARGAQRAGDVLVHDGRSRGDRTPRAACACSSRTACAGACPTGCWCAFSSLDTDAARAHAAQRAFVAALAAAAPEQYAARLVGAVPG
jgi:hypothetical protein